MNGFGVECDDVLFSIQRILSKETPAPVVDASPSVSEPPASVAAVTIERTARADLILLEAVPSFVARSRR
jgi:hypothetical protein